MDFLSIFNDKFGELLRDLKVIFGDDGDLTLLSAGFLFATAASKDGAWRVFHDQVAVPYGPRVMERDERFFLEFEDLKEANAIDIMGRVRGAWKDLSPENRNVIWDYFTLLVKLSDRVAVQMKARA